MSNLLLVGAVLATRSTLNLAPMGASRNAYALSRNEFLPEFFSKVTIRDAPISGTTITSMICIPPLLTEGATAIAAVPTSQQM